MSIIERAITAALDTPLVGNTTEEKLRAAIIAALAAVHEPSDAMVAEGAKRIPGCDPRFYALNAWRDMHGTMMEE